jgi:hypothetical protein
MLSRVRDEKEDVCRSFGTREEMVLGVVQYSALSNITCYRIREGTASFDSSVLEHMVV